MITVGLDHWFRPAEIAWPPYLVINPVLAGPRVSGGRGVWADSPSVSVGR